MSVPYSRRPHLSLILDGAGYASTIYANVGGDSGPGWAAYGNTKPSAWQFNNSADVAGLSVDCNAYVGIDLTKLFGTAPAVAPAPTQSTGAPPKSPL